MADITVLNSTLYQGQPTTPSNPILKLNQWCTASATSITVNFLPVNKSAVAITAPFYIWVKKKNWYVETMLVTNTNSSTTWTVTRGINPNGLDLTTWNATYATEHDAWDIIVFNIPAVFMQQIYSCLQWSIATGKNLFKVWDWTDADIYFYIYNADVNKPYIRYDASDSKWYFSNDWITDLDLAVWWISTAWDWIDITAWTITVDLDTNPWLVFEWWKLRINEDNSDFYYSSTTWNDTYAITTHAWLSAYTEWMKFRIKVDTSNTWACTLNVDWLWAKSIKTRVWNDPSNWDITWICELIYDGTNMVLQKESKISLSKFWWTWADWALSVTSWTTTLSLSSDKLVKNYSSISITWWALEITWISWNNWWLAILKCSWNFTMSAWTIKIDWQWAAAWYNWIAIHWWPFSNTWSWLSAWAAQQFYLSAYWKNIKAISWAWGVWWWVWGWVWWWTAWAWWRWWWILIIEIWWSINITWWTMTSHWSSWTSWWAWWSNWWWWGWWAWWAWWTIVVIYNTLVSNSWTIACNWWNWWNWWAWWWWIAWAWWADWWWWAWSYSAWWAWWAWWATNWSSWSNWTTAWNNSFWNWWAWWTWWAWWAWSWWWWWGWWAPWAYYVEQNIDF